MLIQPEVLCQLGCETPRINYEVYNSRPYRYFYAISSDVDAENPGTVRSHFYIQSSQQNLLKKKKNEKKNTIAVKTRLEW